MEHVVGSKATPGTSSELITVIGVIAVLVVMIIPLPSIILDFLLALNITPCDNHTVDCHVYHKTPGFFHISPATSGDHAFQVVSQCGVHPVDTVTLVMKGSLAAGKGDQIIREFCSRRELCGGNDCFYYSGYC